MIIVSENKKITEGTFIRGKYSPEIMVLEIFKNSKPTIREVNLLNLTAFLDDSFEDGVPVTMTFMTPNGSFDQGEVNHYDKQYIAISSVGEKSPYDFPINEIQKIYKVDYPSGTGFFCMGKRHNSIYLRDY
jgi:hypothetical protein